MNTEDHVIGCAPEAGAEAARPASTGRRYARTGLRTAIALPLFVLHALVCTGQTASHESPSDTVIALGMSTALTGPISFLGTHVRDGVLIALEEANRQGGVHGRQLRLVVLDDGYEPSRTTPNMHRLIEEDGVLAIIGNVGTPTAVVAIPIACAQRVPFFGAFTGAGVLRKTPPDRYVINFRASYAEEAGAMVDALIEEAGLQPTDIAFFTQRDSYGDAGYEGGLSALRNHGLADPHLVVHGRYERNTEAVENGLADILFHDPLPKAIIMVGTYGPCAKFIRLAKQSGLDALFLNVSFVGTGPLVQALGDEGAGTVITQVVPHFDSGYPIIREYRQALQNMGEGTEPSYASLEGYVTARIFLKALASIQGTPTREGVIDALEHLGTFDVGLGAPLRLAPDEHQASHTVWPTIIRESSVAAMDWQDLRAGGAGRP